MRIFDDAEALVQADLEFLKRSIELIDEIYGPTQSTREDVLILENILAVAAHREASMMVSVGAKSLEEAYEILGSSREHADRERAEYYNAMLERAIDLVLTVTQRTAPELLEEVRLQNEQLDLDMQAALVETANKPNLAS